MHKDMFGRVVEVGDVVGWSGSGSGVDTAVVTQIMPKTIKINNAGSIYAPYTVVLNEQMIASGQSEKFDAMRAEYEKYFVHTKPVVRTPNPTFRYSVAFVGDPTNKKMCAFLAKLPHDNNTAVTKPWHQVETDLKDRGFIFVRPSKTGYSSRGYDSLKYRNNTWSVSNDYYAPYQELLLREIKAVGLESFIDQLVGIDDFKNAVASSITGLKYPDFFV